MRKKGKKVCPENEVRHIFEGLGKKGEVAQLKDK